MSLKCVSTKLSGGEPTAEPAFAPEVAPPRVGTALLLQTLALQKPFLSCHSSAGRSETLRDGEIQILT